MGPGSPPLGPKQQNLPMPHYEARFYNAKRSTPRWLTNTGPPCGKRRTSFVALQLRKQLTHASTQLIG